MTTEATVTLGGLTFPLLPTPMAKLAPLFPALERMDPTGASTDGLAAAVEALAVALYHGIRRGGGPGREITQEWVAEQIDMLNMAEIFRVFASVNGIGAKAAA